MKQAGYSGLAQRSMLASGKRKSTNTEEKPMKMPKMEEYKGVHDIMEERGKQKHPTIDDAVYQLGFAKTKTSSS